MPKCRAATADGSPCKNPVKREGDRCWRPEHQGKPGLAMGQRGPKSGRTGGQARPKKMRAGSRTVPKKRRATRKLVSNLESGLPPRQVGRTQRNRTYETLTATQRRRVEAAAADCADVVVDGWRDAVGERVATYVTEETWRRVFRGRRRHRCKLLAEIAAAILEGKKKLHDLVGTAAGWLVGVFGMGSVERQLARELASKIPLPPDGKLVAAARGVQVTGILVCVANGDDLVRCQCFIDLALELTKNQLMNFLSAAMDDWRELARFRPRTGPLAAPT